MKKPLRIAIVVAIIIGLIAFRQLRDTPDAARAEASSARYVVPAGATAFRFGSLDFTRCELSRKRSAATTEAYCAPFEVAEDPQQPQGRRIALNLAMIKSAEAPDDDFIVFLAGGPGQAAIEAWPQVASAFAPASRRRHVLLLDQRGTGGSNALDCDLDESADALVEFDMGTIIEHTRRCRDKVSAYADPAHYTTSVAVEDLETLRQALGAPRFNLVGISYGTRVAQQYLKRHPQGVRSIVLDSPVPNELVLGGEFARNLDDALKAQFALCTADADCAQAFGDPYAKLMRLRDSLRATPREVSFSDPVTFTPTTRRLDEYGLAGLVRLFAYSPESAALIPLSIDQALAGNHAPLMGQLKMLQDGMAELAGSGMQLSVACAEDADQAQPDPNAADLLLGNLLVDVIKAQCTIWPRGVRPADFNEPATGDTPVLVLAGEFDPVTPPRYGEDILRHLTRARLLVVKGQGHAVIGRGCLPSLVSRFMDDPDPHKLDISCADVLGPVPHLINFNGAAP